MKLPSSFIPTAIGKEARKPVLPLNEGDRFEIEVEILGFNSFHQRVTFGEFIPRNEIKAKTAAFMDRSLMATVKTQSIQPPVERPKRRRRKPRKNEEPEEKRG